MKTEVLAIGSHDPGTFAASDPSKETKSRLFAKKANERRPYNPFCW